VRSRTDAPSELRQLIKDSTTPDFPKGILLDRLNQFLEESERIIPAAADALRAGDLTQLGRLVDQSQQWSQKGLQNQIPQTIFLAQSARHLGAAAASAFGAGFGGSVWALVPKPLASTFQNDWLALYREAFPIQAQTAQTFISPAGQSASFT
jgi:galactokinase